jgi:octaprenyl-diphosphate synthase
LLVAGIVNKGAGMMGRCENPVSGADESFHTKQNKKSSFWFAKIGIVYLYPLKMSVSLSHIQDPIAAEMEAFEQKFRASMRTRVLLLDKIMRYIVKRKGKQMRPMFVFLSAGAASGGIEEPTYRGAALIELLHTATLVHDDVVDDASHRRGFFSVNALWKNKIAVLVGDYLLSRGLLLSVDNGDFDLLKIVSNAVREMSEGELLQIEKARLMDITEAVYYEIICKKTASLIASCCAVGAASVGGSQELVERMRLFGEKVGMAFQIKDDLFDYGEEEIGKPVGIDIKERKMTLPLIYALNQSSWLERRRIIYIVKNQSDKPKKVREVIEYVKASGGIRYAQGVMNRYIDEAMQLLVALPDSAYKTSLQQLVAYTIERNK